ncbi:unnamed protein product [Ectocarpus sp. 12 AP-2014]
MSRTSKLSTLEAMQILNLQKGEMKPDLIKQRYDQYFGINDPDKGGSFYLQSKVFRAKEALDEQLALQAKQASEEAALKAKAAAGGKGGAGGAKARPAAGGARRPSSSRRR